MRYEDYLFLILCGAGYPTRWISTEARCSEVGMPIVEWRKPRGTCEHGTPWDWPCLLCDEDERVTGIGYEERDL